jgi:hypothetical protein
MMRIVWPSAVIAAVITLAPAVAHAEVVVPPPDSGDSTGAAPEDATKQPLAPTVPAPSRARDLSHRGQFGLSMRTGVAFRWLTPYDSGDYCGERSPDTASGNSPVCLGRAPMSLDFEVSYGASSKADAILEMRVGVERDFSAAGNSGNAGPRLFHLAPGVRYYYAEGASSKLFTTAQLVLDLTGYQDAAGKDRGVDFGLRSINGLWFDFRRNLAGYIYLGGTLTAVRWLRVDIEGGVGIQFRYPS